MLEINQTQGLSHTRQALPLHFLKSQISLLKASQIHRDKSETHHQIFPSVFKFEGILLFLRVSKYSEISRTAKKEPYSFMRSEDRNTMSKVPPGQYFQRAL